jgi:outer membrane receptor protein involved in Fe transport
MRNALACALLLLLCSAAAFGQAGSGSATISGVVRDPSGAVVPNANVVISSEGRGVIRTLSTNGAGVFTVSALVPGTGYKVAVTAPGFSGYEAKGVELRVGQNLDLNVTLTVATTATTVEVTAAAPLVEYAKTDLSAIVDTRQIQDLPINGRRVDQFVLLTPGVSNDGTYGLLTFRGVAGQNSFLVDGVDTTEQFYNENAGRTRIASQLSQEAVDQFQVVSSNYTAEYGRAMGGVVNTVTKSGNNTLHGSAFWFYRSTGFDARDPFTTFNPSEKRNQIGGSIGGAIQKDKLFYFLSTEISRRDFPLASSVNTTAVSGATQTWNLCGVGAGSVPAATSAQCAAINGLLPRFYGQIPRTLDQELYLGKLDYHLSNRNTLSASFNFLHALSPNGIQTGASLTTGTAITSNGDDAVTVRNGRVQWIASPTSTFGNEFRFGLATDRQADTFDNSLLGPGLGYLAVSVNGTGMGSTSYLPRIEPMERRFQFVDNVTWEKGTHTIKFGTDIATTRDYVYYISNYNGSYTYQTVNAFALDYSGNTSGAKHWQSYTQTFGNPAVDYHINDWGFYLQDQWRATSRLMLNYGVRYEYAQISQPKVCNQDYPLTCKVPSSKNNFAPRVGLSYRLNDKTVLQAGYGIFFARFQGGTLDDLYTSGNGVYQTSVSLAATQSAQLAAGPVFPNILPGAPTGGTVSAASIQMLAPNLKTPYSEQGNIGIQRQLTNDTVLTVSYLWSRGVQLYGIRDLNMPTGTTNYTYTIVDASGSTVGSYTTPVYTGKRPDTRYSTIAYAENGVNSYYNGLAVEATKRFSYGFQATASYTWSHEIDDGQNYGESTNNLWLSSPSYWISNGNYNLDKGSGNLDQRHRFVFDWVWAPRFTCRDSAFFKYFVNGWQFSNITTMASGHPYGSTQIYVTDTPVTGMFSNYTVNGSGFSSRVPWLPAQNYYLPATYRADVRLSKVLPITERCKLSLNFEVFNVANNWSATGFSSSRAYSEAKGVITATPSLLYVPNAAYGSPDGTQARRMQISMRFTF